MTDHINHESDEMINKRGIPLRGWETVKKKYGKAAGTNKALALLRRLDREKLTKE